MKYYEKWIPGDDRPEALPKNCETFDLNNWEKSNLHPSKWGTCKRWEVTEAQWRMNRIAETVGFDKQSLGEMVDFSVGEDGVNTTITITYREIDQWITELTDEDAKLRPGAQFADNKEFANAISGILIGVVDYLEFADTSTGLVGCVNRVFYISSQADRWDYCRVKKSELDKLGSKK